MKLWITVPMILFIMIAEEVNATMKNKEKIVTTTQEEVNCLAENIYFEARGESTPGRMAVALVTLNRVKDNRFPDTVCGVVKQTKYYPSGKIDLHSCQFSWYCDGKSDKVRDYKVWEDIHLIAEVMYEYESVDVTQGALWYHSPAVKPKWSMVYNKTVKIDNHIFYKDVD